MANVLEMDQKTPEWHALRSQHFTASEAAGMLGCSPWAPNSPREVMEYKLGLRSRYQSRAMERGNELEAEALAYFNFAMAANCKPIVFTRGRMMASCDGWDQTGGGTIVEVKCPTSRDAMTLGEPPKHYLAQVAVQWYCAPPEKRRNVFLMYYWPAPASGGDPDVNLFRVSEEKMQSVIDELLPIVHANVDHLLARTVPELGKNDVLIRDDSIWAAAAEDYKLAAYEASVAKEAVEDAKDRLKELCVDGGIGETGIAEGGGVRVALFTTSGSIDWEKIRKDHPEAFAGIDVESYRKKSSPAMRVTVLKTDGGS